ncbi:MAG TPA: hypothetical protein VN673_03370, partial [Clostridia bacterium]|nr:hypothetical protein [Clostridia bacterium]
KKKGAEEDELGPRMSLRERWGVEVAHASLDHDGENYQSVVVENVSGLPLPANLDWHSGLVFTNLNLSWEPIYRRDAGPVVVHKQLGSGTIVLASDSYFLSNEGLRKDSQPDLLLWLIGPGTGIVFDEAHHGLTDSPGVAGLMRRYRLHGVVAALLLLTGLFIWKNAFSFVPPAPVKLAPGFVAGKEASGGFINLLRRNIVPGEVLRTCFAEWTQSMLLQRRGHLIARVDRAQSLLEAEDARALRDRNPVRAYIEICHALKGGAGAPGPAESAVVASPSATPSNLEHEHRNT